RQADHRYPIGGSPVAPISNFAYRRCGLCGRLTHGERSRRTFETAAPTKGECMQGKDANDGLELNQPVTQLPAYAPPTVTTYTDEQLLEALGPAQARAYGPG